MYKSFLNISALLAVFGLFSGQTAASDVREPATLEETVAVLDAVCVPTRPKFRGAKARMRKSGLTEVKEGAHLSPDKLLSAETGELRSGHRTCSVRSTFKGSPQKLQRALAKRFGPATNPELNISDRVLPKPVYDRGDKGKVLLLLYAHAGPYTIYDLGYLEGLK